MRVTHRTATIAALIAVACLGVVTVLAAGVGVVRWERHQETETQRAEQLANQQPSGSDEVVTFSGLADVRFGDTVSELTADHGLSQPKGACVMQFGDLHGVDPVFVSDRLVLLWVHAPVHTPEGIMEGSSVESVRQAYPGGVDLTPPPGSHAYPGILVRQGDAAYLFLHDGTTVKKEIAGYADYVQRLYTDGFGPC